MRKSIRPRGKQATPEQPGSTRAYLTPAGLRFLSGLARNNNRDWFNERKQTYDAEVKRPMLAVIEAVTGSMIDYAPAHVRAPEKILMRIYRDTRFSKEKLPYKTHVAAWWARDGLMKTSGAGFYLHVSGSEIEIAAGVFMPDAAQLMALRRFLLEHAEEYSALLAAKDVRRLFEEEEGRPLSRSPKGFPREHPAAALFRQRRWGVHAQLEAPAATQADFAKLVAGYFRSAARLVEFLNRPLVAPRRRRPMF